MKLSYLVPINEQVTFTNLAGDLETRKFDDALRFEHPPSEKEIADAKAARIAGIISVWTTPVALSLDDLRQRALARLEANFAAALAAGIIVHGITLAADDSTLTKLTGKRAMLMDAMEFGYITAESPVTVFDLNGAEVTMTVTEFRKLLLSFGSAYEHLFATKKAEEARILSASADEL